MRKLIISLLAVSLLVVMPLAAQNARTNGMQVGANDVEDIGNIATFPELALKYGDTLYLRNVDNKSAAGYLFKTMGDYVVGVGLVDNTGSISVSNNVASVSLYAPSELIQATFAAPLGGANAGAVVSYGLRSKLDEQELADAADPADKFTNDRTDEDASSSILGFRVGAGKEEVGPLDSVDVAAGMQMVSASNEYTDGPDSRVTADGYVYLDTIETDGVTTLDIDALAVHAISDATSLRYQVGFNSYSSTTNSTDTYDSNGDGDFDDGAGESDVGGTSEYTNSTIAVRVAANTTVNDDDLVVCTVGLSMYSYENSGSEDVYSAADSKRYTTASWANEGGTTALTLGLAGEGNLSDNVAVRGGVEKGLELGETINETNVWGLDSTLEWANTLKTTDTVNTKDVNAVVSNAGLTLKAGNWVIDAELVAVNMLADCIATLDATLNF